MLINLNARKIHSEKPLKPILAQALGQYKRFVFVFVARVCFYRSESHCEVGYIIVITSEEYRNSLLYGCGIAHALLLCLSLLFAASVKCACARLAESFLRAPRRRLTAALFRANKFYHNSHRNVNHFSSKPDSLLSGIPQGCELGCLVRLHKSESRKYT